MVVLVLRVCDVFWMNWLVNDIRCFVFVCYVRSVLFEVIFELVLMCDLIVECIFVSVWLSFLVFVFGRFVLCKCVMMIEDIVLKFMSWCWKFLIFVNCCVVVIEFKFLWLWNLLLIVVMFMFCFILCMWSSWGCLWVMYCLLFNFILGFWCSVWL